MFEIDNHAGAAAMTRHLLSLGHRHLAFIGGPEHNHDARERLRGFRDAIAAQGDARGSEFSGDFDEASGHRAGLGILAADDRPDAVFAANDMMALGCLYAFAQAGLEVPRDVALAGFDDIPLARFVHPSLTTMRVSIAELGANALKRLLAQIDASEPAAIEHHVLVPELVVRQSSGDPVPAHAARRAKRK